MSDILALARPEIRALVPAAVHGSGTANSVRLHANEIPWADARDEAPVALNRYYDGQPRALVEALAAHYGADPSSVLVTRGSDDAIDLLVRAFCRAGQDRILVCPPTFGMYRFSAEVQGAGVVAVPPGPGFGLDADALVARWTPEVKIVFLCSPNNPTGNALDPGAVVRVLDALAGRAIVVMDEAYIEFSARPGFIGALARHPNLVVLRTLSKAHGLAGARCGVAIASAELVALLGRLMPPYALPGPTVTAALAALDPQRLLRTRKRIEAIVAERGRLAAALEGLTGVRQVWPSEGNFLLVRFEDAAAALESATRAGLLLRDFSRQPPLEGCLRITVGSREENDCLLSALGGAVPAADGAAVHGTRRASVARKTRETDIEADVDLDRTEPVAISTGIGFYDHMLEQVARHGGFSLRLRCRGDLHVDEHHTVEDSALAAGAAIREALGAKRGIGRYGFVLPMDESEARVLVDLSGRAFSVFEGSFTRDAVGGLPTELVPHFFRSLADSLGATIHVEVRGENAHHMVEACFKGLGRALRQAVRREGDVLPSTKGLL